MSDDAIDPGATPDAVDAVDAVDAAMARGNAAYEAGDLAGAIAAYEDAVKALGPADDGRAADIHENLGIAYWRTGRWRPAIRAFLRVLDGDPGAREQTLRLLVGCLFRDGLPLDGERLLAAYEARFGPHPEGWTRG
jgi:tetratricopeptide (TPR) repeat protein